MRVIFNNSRQRDSYFSTLKKRSDLSWLELYSVLGVKGRMLRFWRSGQLSTPKDLTDKIQRLYGIKLPKGVEIVPLYRHVREAGRKGAYRRLLLYGNFGTPEGRRKGGLNSLKSRKLRNTNFKFRKQISIPERSEKLAEAIGILIGDGGITHFQVRVTLGLKTDKNYAFYIKSLFEELFAIDIPVYEQDSRSTIWIVASSVSLVELLMGLGLPLGNKVKQEIDVPGWIKRNRSLSRSCLRGIFDTDGCLYLDKHKIKNKSYASANIDFTSASPKLLDSIEELLRKESFRPKRSSRRSIRLRRNGEVVRFFELVGSRNPKNLEKFYKFLGLFKEEYRSGYNGTASKADGVVRPT